jgi:hypothetical protein
MRSRVTGRLASVAASFLILAQAGVAHAGDARRFSAAYTVSLFGLTLARTSFTSTVDSDSFSIRGSIASAGVARIIDDTRGTTSVSGRLTPSGAEPQSFLVAYTSGKKKKRTAIEFSGDTVSHTENIPPLKKKKNWVPLGPDDLKAVTDPLSLTLVKADSSRAVCDHTLKYYDGELRADIKLSYAGTAPYTVPGFSGKATVCNAHFVPVAGYRSTNSTLKFLRDKSRITISFVPMGKTGIYAPIAASVGTKIGTVEVRADKFTAGQ